ncbi:hypothetical protein BJY01DRAFT_254948 [Aspergillus pseudoustus]|uniref:MalT-like TPR region domain-containing protein n=1 Tax=Aspergillus pseudoustus TaxID=1810923 RepID=A0ABR4IPA9_9EURO
MTLAEMSNGDSSPSGTFLRLIAPGKEPKIDIIAIHGLNPKNKERHAERTWELDGKLWLRDFLPHQLPQARIFLFGYNSSVSIRSSSAGVREQAQNLLSRLLLERQGCHSRPIIFIAHSLGGIVVKEALVQAKLGAIYDSIRIATYGIAFFGTPHRGSHLAKMGETVAKAVRAFLRTPNNTFINALKENDLYANELSANFQQLLEDYQYINFYETLPLRSLGIIVEKKSATFGLPDTREITIAVAGDHESICRFRSEDDDNYIHVSGLILKFAAIAMHEGDTTSLFRGSFSKDTTLVATNAEQRICMIPFARNPAFVDRAPVMSQLRERIFPIGNASRIALFGLGGIGKSQIAIEFAHEICTQYQASVFWVSASSIDRFREGFTAIFEKHVASGADEDCDKLTRVKDWLEQEHRDWVLIIDNADETSLFEANKVEKADGKNQSILNFLPESDHGITIVTTRNRAAGVKFTKGLASSLIEVHPMTGEESKCLIKNAATNHYLEESEMNELSDLLGHLPLAIVQAAAFMQENSMSISEYIELYNDSDETRMDLLCEPFEALGRDTGVPNAVVTTIIVSIDQIKERDPRAIDILSLIAFLDRNEIPKSLIQHKIKRLIDLAKGLGTLKAFSLVVSTDTKGNFSLHRLVQLVLRKWLILEGHFEQKSIQAMELLADIYPDATFENWATCASYLPHAQSVLSLIPEVLGEMRRRRIHLQEGIAYYLWSQGRSQEAEKLDLQLVEDKKKEFGPDHEETLESIAGLAATYYDQARWTEAEKLDSLIVDTRKRVLGPRDKLTLTSVANFATTIESLGRMEEAESLRLEVLEISKAEFGEDDEKTIDAMANLGPLYLDTGREDEAADLMQKVVTWRLKKFGPEHKHSLTSLSVLAEAYKAQGKLDGAEELTLQTFAAKEKSLGAQHPDTRAEMTLLADIYQKQGRLDDAETLLVQAIGDEDQDRQPKYDTMDRQLRLANIHWAQGREEQAEKLEDEALSSSLKVLGQEHPFTLKCLSAKAFSQRRRGKDSNAVQLMTRVAHESEKSLGPYHEDTLHYLHLLTEWCGDDVAIDKLLEIEGKEEKRSLSWDDWAIV